MYREILRILLTKDCFHVTSPMTVQHLICVVICNAELSWRHPDIFAVFLMCRIDVKIAFTRTSFVHQLQDVPS